MQQKRDNDLEDDRDEKSVKTEAEKIYISDLRKDAIKNYNEYLTRAKDLDDEEDVKAQIGKLEGQLNSDKTEP